jgi:uncharacterized protein (DUF486 family)
MSSQVLRVGQSPCPQRQRHTICDKRGHAAHPHATAAHGRIAMRESVAIAHFIAWPMQSIALTVLLLTLSNVFMTFAWYAHLKELSHKPWLVAALVSWGIALFEYLLQVPANRIGYSELSVAQLKILQEVITLSVFVPFAWFYLKEPLKLDYFWAALCVLGAVFFVFRSRLVGS